jgi:hypothetical protein
MVFFSFIDSVSAYLPSGDRLRTGKKTPSPSKDFGHFTHLPSGATALLGSLPPTQLGKLGIIPPCAVSSPCNAFQTQVQRGRSSAAFSGAGE